MKLNRILFVLAACLVVIGVANALADDSQAQLSVRNTDFVPEFVTTTEDQQQGLSGRDSLADNAAMVFVFDKPDIRCFWMKDMRFSLDIIWLDSDKQVNAMEQSVQPSTYPSSFCHVDAQYVVEFSAGVAQELDLGVGDKFTF